jgi:hypothetical protein
MYKINGKVIRNKLSKAVRVCYSTFEGAPINYAYGRLISFDDEIIMLVKDGIQAPIQRSRLISIILRDKK